MLNRTIILLSLVSFFTDIASEMLYPIMPIYLASLGMSVMVMGVLEGFSQVLVGATKFIVSLRADQIQERVFFIRIGYLLSAIAKPLYAMTSSTLGIFGLRTLDRLGKGIRTTPRDALLSLASTPQTRGRVFGFHRSIDTLGAVIGPIITMILLFWASGNNISTIIQLTLIPGAIAVILTFFLRRESRPPHRSPSKTSWQEGVSNFFSQAVITWRASSPTFRRIVFFFTLIALLKSTDIYLLIRAKELGLSDAMIVSAYVVYNLVLTAAVALFGYISDRWGYRGIVVYGFLALALTYGLFGSTTLSVGMIFFAFAMYGIFVAIFESMGVAWASLHIHSTSMTTGLGIFALAQSGALFVGSIIVGILWTTLGGQITCLIVSGLVILISIWMYLSQIGKDDHQSIEPYYPCVR